MVGSMDNYEQGQGRAWDIDKITTAITTLLITALMLGAFRISFSSMSEEAMAFGIKNHKVFPFIVDGFIVVASGLMLWGEFRKEGEVVSIGWYGVVLATALTLIFNVSHAPYVKEIVASGWKAVTYRPLSIVFQTLYAATSPALLAFALHALTKMLGKIVSVSTELMDLRKAKQEAETLRNQAETAQKQLETRLQQSEVARQELETRLEESETRRTTAETEANQYLGKVQLLENQVATISNDLAERETSWVIWNMIGERGQQFFVQVVLEQAISQRQFATQFDATATDVTRVKKFLQIEQQPETQKEDIK